MHWVTVLIKPMLCVWVHHELNIRPAIAQEVYKIRTGFNGNVIVVVTHKKQDWLSRRRAGLRASAVKHYMERKI